MDIQSIIVISLTIFVFVGFVWEKFAPDLIALLAVSVLLATKIIDTSEFLQVFSNSATITIAMMFIISSAMERTGCLQIMGNFISKIAGKSYLRAMLSTMTVAMVISAFMNNTPVVIVMTPIIISLAHSIGVSPSKMLIPLSFASIFGGTATLIGTSTNILVSDVAVQNQLAGIGMFEMTIPAIIFAFFGIAYMTFVGRYLLPERYSISSVLDDQPKKQFIAEILIPSKSSYVGKTVAEANFVKEYGKIIDLVRGDKSLFYDSKLITIEAGDRIILETNVGEILGLKKDGQIEFNNNNKDLQTLSASKRVILEASISSKSNLCGKYLSDVNLQKRYGVYVIAVNQHDDNTDKDLNKSKLVFGDTLLIEGKSEGISRFIEDANLINLTQPQAKEIRKSKAPIAFITIISVVLLASLNIMPIAGLAIIGASIVMFTGCVDPEEAYKSIDWRILFLIFGMLGLSMAMEKTGVAETLVNYSILLVEDFGPIATLAIIYIMTSILTEMISNNAVAVLITPIAIGIANQLGYDSRPFIMAVMFAASASFATPVGYQTNTFIYGAGGYKFIDFVKVGLPLNIMFAILATIILPIFFPF